MKKIIFALLLLASCSGDPCEYQAGDLVLFANQYLMIVQPTRQGACERGVIKVTPVAGGETMWVNIRDLKLPTQL